MTDQAPLALLRNEQTSASAPVAHAGGDTLDLFVNKDVEI
jgi:hypothetical protein